VREVTICERQQTVLSTVRTTGPRVLLSVHLSNGYRGLFPWG